jgi:membrane dipeptidase
MIFDGHNDTITSGRSFFDRSTQGHIDLPRARDGGLGGGFFAVFTGERAPRPGSTPAQSTTAWMLSPEGVTVRVTDDLPPIPLEEAQSEALYWIGALLQLECASKGQCKIIQTASELQRCLDRGIFAILLHLEGAYPLDPDGCALEVFYKAGVRSVGVAHFRPNRFAVGVARRFPHTPDIGPGLTEAGKTLVRQCNRHRVLVDLSHANEQTFWDVAKITDAPLVVTHGSAWELSNASRNLTDKQLAAIRESHGMVGVIFHVGMLRSDGRRDPNTPLSVLVNHVDYLVDKLGIDSVGFGSDFDGATMPAALKDAADLPNLLQALRNRGYGDDALRKIAHGNWVRVLRETWGS